MKRKAIVAAPAAALTAGAAYNTVAAEQGAPAQKTQPETIYGYRMMTDAERNEYREKMRNAKTVKERQAVRAALAKAADPAIKARCRRAERCSIRARRSRGLSP